MKAFIDLKLEPGIYKNREIEPGVFGKFANNTHQLPIRMENNSKIEKWYYNNKGWCMGCYYIKNPLHMTLDNFKELLRKIALKFDFIEGKKYFEGNCEELMKNMKEFMDILMDFLNNEIQIEVQSGVQSEVQSEVQSGVQRKIWSYHEDQWEKKYTIKKRFALLDNFIKKQLI